MSERSKHTQLISSQRSVHFTLRDVADQDRIELGTHDEESSFYVRLLADDVSQALMLGMHKRTAPAARVLLETSQVEPSERDSREEWVARSIARRNGYPAFGGDTLMEAVADFFQECAWVIMTYGEAIYEIVYWEVPTTHGVADVTLRLVPPGSVVQHRGRYVQHVPPSIARQRGCEARIEIPEDRTLRFGPPVSVRDGFDHIRVTLASLHAMQDVLSAMERSHADSSPLPFDPNEHVRAERLAAARATRTIGWNVRRLIYGQVSDYYWVYRQLRFERFKCELRDEIMGTLNSGLLRIGQHLGFAAQIRLEGVPTVADVDGALTRLAAGSQALGEVLNPFLRA